MNRLYFRAVIVGLVLALGSIGLYYILPLEMRSPLLFTGVVPIFLLLPVTALIILGVFLILIVSLVAQRMVIEAAKKRERISIEDLAMETGILRQDLLLILKDLQKKKKILFVTDNEISYLPAHSET